MAQLAAARQSRGVGARHASGPSTSNEGTQVRQLDDEESHALQPQHLRRRQDGALYSSL
jgi:hypothetical protein